MRRELLFGAGESEGVHPVVEVVQFGLPQDSVGDHGSLDGLYLYYAREIWDFAYSASPGTGHAVTPAPVQLLL